MEKEDTAVMVLESGTKAEDAVRVLARGGFDTRLLSLIGKGLAPLPAFVGGDDTGNQAERRGAVVGPGEGMWGLLLAPSMLRLPGVGAVAAGGPLAMALSHAPEHAATDESMAVIGKMLLGIGVPSGRIVKYELALKTGKCLLMIHGDVDAVASALAILAEAWAWEVA